MLPTAQTLRKLPHLRSSAVKIVVVDLPFVPVIATIGAAQRLAATSSSPVIGIPAERASCKIGMSNGTPGERTIKSDLLNAALIVTTKNEINFSIILGHQCPLGARRWISDLSQALSRRDHPVIWQRQRRCDGVRRHANSVYQRMSSGYLPCTRDSIDITRELRLRTR